jgi:hypothetical protein
MKQWVCLFLVALIGLPAFSARANVIHLLVGDAVTLGNTYVTCNPGPNDDQQQSVIQRLCAQEDSWGRCTYFDETVLSGRFCAQGKVCGRVDNFGRCTYYNNPAGCGEKSCTKSKKCGLYDNFNRCQYENITVQCE